jgi:hypothetical protein
MCCATIDMSSLSAAADCRTACAGTMQEVIMCHTSADCTGGKTCKSCQPPGGPPTLMCVVNDTCP